MIPHFPVHFEAHTGPAKLNLKFHFSSAWRGTDNPKTSPQSDHMATTSGSSCHRWDVRNRWLRYCFTLGFTLSILAPVKSTLAYVLAPWITGKPVHLKKKKVRGEKTRSQRKKKVIFWRKSLNNLTWNAFRGLSESWIFHPNALVFSYESGSARALSKVLWLLRQVDC